MKQQSFGKTPEFFVTPNLTVKEKKKEKPKLIRENTGFSDHKNI